MSNGTKEQAKSLQEIWAAFLQTGHEADRPQRHLPDALLYDLALGEPLPEQRQEALGHLADCDECVQRLVGFQAAIAADKKVRAVWNPQVLRAAGEEQSLSVIKDLTEDGKYLITLQPTRDGQKDLFTLEVTASVGLSFEGQEVLVVSGKTGTVVLHGTISGGNITRLIDRKLRDEWPFRIQAG
ncbi:MAG: hypothetical protein ACRERD_33210 [Candidatus Binatia bacterium]